MVKFFKFLCWLDFKLFFDEGGGGFKYFFGSQIYFGVWLGRYGKWLCLMLYWIWSQVCIEKDIFSDELIVFFVDIKLEEFGLCKVYDEIIVMEVII